MQKLKCFNREVRVKTSTRGIVRIEVNQDFLKVTIPKGVDPMFVIRKNKDWIEKHVEIIEEAKEISKDLMLITRTEDDFRKLVRERLKEIGKEVGVFPKRLRFKYMRSKWGSWSRKSVLTLNSFLRFLPRNLIDYVIFHELLHFYEPFHTDEFYVLLSHYVKDYEKLDVELLAYWMVLKKTGIVEKYVKSKKITV